MNSAINCVFDLALALAECARCLTPDGYLWVAQGVFRYADAPSVGANASESVLGNVFVRAVSLEQFEGLCLRAGFRSVEVLSRAVIVPDGDDARETCVQASISKLRCACGVNASFGSMRAQFLCMIMGNLRPSLPRMAIGCSVWYKLICIAASARRRAPYFRRQKVGFYPLFCMFGHRKEL